MRAFVLLLLSLFVFSCGKRDGFVYSTSGNYCYKIDTVCINGIKHEFVIKTSEYLNGICHSPECPCLKNE